MAKKVNMAQSLSEGLTARFDNQEECDVAFMVEGKCIKAHKLVIGVRSKVLDDLSRGWNPDMDPIPIDTTDYTSFEALLRYLYNGEIAISEDNVFIFLSAATSFKMDFLEQECVEHIEKTMNSSNVCHFMNEAVGFKSVLLQEKCCKLFEKETSCISESSFTELSQSALSAFLEADEINVLEIALFYSIERWMKAECEKQNIETNGENMRQVIGDALFKIRFPTMTVQDFANCVTTIDGFLTDSEIKQTFQKIAVFNNKDIECPFPSEFRCCNVSLYTAFRDMEQLLKKPALFQLNGNQCFDAESMAVHVESLISHQDMFPPSFRLLMQCCADMSNSCHVTMFPNATNVASRKNLREKLQKWKEATKNDPKNVSAYMTAFMDFRSDLDELTNWSL